MPEIEWVDDISGHGLRIGVDEWGGLHFDIQDGSDRIALDPDVVTRMIKARSEIV